MRVTKGQTRLNNFQFTYGRKSRETKESLDEGETGEWKTGLKLNVQKMKIMASGPITSWKIDGEKWKHWQTLFSWAPKSLQLVTAAMKLKMLAPWKKSYDQPRSILKSRDITLPTKVCLAKTMVFLVVMYGYQSWTIKKAEHRRTDDFERWCRRRLLRVPSTAGSNQPILKEISPEYSLDWCWSWNSNTLTTQEKTY